MTHRFVVRQLAALDNQRPRLASERAGRAAGRTGLLRPQRLGLLFQEDGNRPLRQSGRSRLSDLFHGGQIDVGAGSGVAEGASGDDLTPLGGQFADILEVLGVELRVRHRLSLLELAQITKGARLPTLYRKRVRQAKQVLASQ
jgi:hypothetical protein